MHRISHETGRARFNGTQLMHATRRVNAVDVLENGKFLQDINLKKNNYRIRKYTYIDIKMRHANSYYENTKQMCKLLRKAENQVCKWLKKIFHLKTRVNFSTS